jgi:hypothetical protein
VVGDRLAVKRALLILAIFALVGGSHYASPIVQSGDSTLAIYVALSLVRHGDTNLDEYSHPGNPHTDVAVMPHYIKQVGEHRYWHYPIGTPLVVAPAVFVIDAIPASRRAFGLDDIQREPPFDLERLLASLIVGVATVFVFLTARRSVELPFALGAAFVFAFCTPAWSTASRGLWQHGPSLMLLSIAVYLLKTRALAYAGLPLALAYVVRPTNAIALVVFSAYVAWRHRAQLGRYLIGCAAVLVPFMAYSLSVYGRILPPYFSGDAGFAGEPDVLAGALGLLVSPSRGLFVFSPVLLLALLGATKRPLSGLDKCMGIVVLLHWLVMARSEAWWGGHCFGPRYFTDMVAFLVLLALPLLSISGRARALLAAGFVLLAVPSFWINFRGATAVATAEWNVTRADGTPVVNEDWPARVWDLRDVQFLRQK